MTRHKNLYNRILSPSFGFQIPITHVKHYLKGNADGTRMNPADNHFLPAMEELEWQNAALQEEAWQNDTLRKHAIQFIAEKGLLDEYRHWGRKR